MAKVSFTKLGLSKNQEIKTIEYNEQNIEVKQYLPINEKLTLISNVINESYDENNFANPVKVSIFGTLEILYFYTNINFTDKQKEDPAKLYDLLVGNGFLEVILEAIPREEYCQIVDGIDQSIKAFYDYRNSAVGILDAVSSDYSNLNLDATEIQQKLADPQNMELLKSVLSKLG